jgi:hypothetical protein
MRSILFALAATLACVGAAEARGGGGGGHSSSGGSHSISGYTRSNGTYVAPSHGTNPNSSKSDNWTTKGNVNPYTGQAGTKNP